MHQLFLKRPTVVRGLFQLPAFTYIRNGLSTNLVKLVSFYRENPRAVRSDHFLVRLLQSIAVSHQHEPVYYVDLVSDIADELAMSLGMTSPLYPGRVFDPGIFYGRGTSEVLVSATVPFDAVEAAKDWEDLEPIWVLSHPKTDLNMDLPIGRSNGGNGGMAVIAINIPMLALQYRQWRAREQLLRPDNQRSLMQFLCLYPLANMLRSHLDIALFNRLRAHFHGRVPLESIRRPPLHVIRYEDKVDALLSDLVTILKRKNQYFDAVLASIPLVVENNALNRLMLPKLPPTRQVLWALTLARLDTVAFLVQLEAESNMGRNQQSINKIRRGLIQLKNDRVWQQALPRELYHEVMTYIDDEITAYIP